MGTKRHYYLPDLEEELGISEDAVREFISLGILVPDGWYNPDIQIRINKEGLGAACWLDFEVERFQKMLRLAHRQHVPLMARMEALVHSHLNDFGEKLKQLQRDMDKVSGHMHQLRRDVFKNEQMVDLNYFCKLTGYKHQTVLNNREYMNAEHTMMRLQFNAYKDLIWYKIKGKWQASYGELMELRRHFTYELYLDERKRKGDYIPKMKVDFNKMDI